MTMAASSVTRRFGVQTLLDSPDPFVATMPVGGLVNHHRRTVDE
jgi:hypothetical protein